MLPTDTENREFCFQLFLTKQQEASGSPGIPQMLTSVSSEIKDESVEQVEILLKICAQINPVSFEFSKHS